LTDRAKEIAERFIEAGLAAFQRLAGQGLVLVE
jgi:hypothetical protein